MSRLACNDRIDALLTAFFMLVVLIMIANQLDQKSDCVGSRTG
jgi:hypothetical protein